LEFFMKNATPTAWSLDFEPLPPEPDAAADPNDVFDYLDELARCGAFDGVRPALGDIVSFCQRRGIGTGSVLTEWKRRGLRTAAEATGPRPNPPDDDARPHGVDVTTLTHRPPRTYIIEGVFPVASVFGIAGEEGDGKTLMAEQMIREMLRGEKILEFFDLGEAAPSRVLFIDTEMEEEDAVERHAEMVGRGLDVSPGMLYWLAAGGLALDEPDDLAYIEREIRQLKPDLVWIDSAVNAVSEAEEGSKVKLFFNNLSKPQRATGVLGIGLTLHTRKRGQGRSQKRFDDLFGSREWKGRPNTVLYIEDTTIWAWKNRGGRLNKMFKKEGGQRPYATLNRPGLEDETVLPFTISLPEERLVARNDRANETAIVAFLILHPGQYTKSAVADAVEGRREDILREIERLQDEGVVVPNKARAKLCLAKQLAASEGVDE
jgi:hypothetical protein